LALARTLHQSSLEVAMRIGFCVAAAVLAGGVAFSAQDMPKTKVVVEDGKEMTVTGCVSRGADGGYTLTHAAGKDGVVGSYILARLDTDEDDQLDKLKDHVGHRVEVKGKAADKGNGRLRIQTESKRTETRSEVKGDLDGLPFLGVKSSRMIASVCP
jgi:hypothetical protein